MIYQRCIECGKTYEDDEIVYRCECNGLLEIVYDFDKIEVDKEKFKNRVFSVWRYFELLPIKNREKIISLKEGGTPLYRCRNLEEELGVKELYVKNEGANPTGSFKDRGMTVGVSKANELNIKVVGCASTGNTSASLAAYSARAKMKCLVLLPKGKVALGKLAQAMIYGAKVVEIDGNFDKALEMVNELAKEGLIYLLNSINPFRLEGQKTIGYEIADELNWEVPDRVIVPVGNAGNISAIWKGFKEFYELGFINELPKMTGIQAEGAKPIVEAFKKGKREIEPYENPETIATAIRIGKPVNAKKALNAIYESNGYAESVSDEEIIKAQKLLARKEGIFVEPASASSIAGLIKLLDEGVIDRSERIVCITTGHGLKDPDAAIRACEETIKVKSLDELKKLLSS